MVLVFDQFEDAFRQGTLFSSSYKLLNDTHEARANLVIGFSLKSEINIPADHEAYYLWQQAKTNAIEMRMPEFVPKDLRAVTRQLEGEIDTKLPSEFKTKLIEISQGFPWLMKKLCIHVYEQLKAPPRHVSKLLPPIKRPRTRLYITTKVGKIRRRPKIQAKSP